MNPTETLIHLQDIKTSLELWTITPKQAIDLFREVMKRRVEEINKKLPNII